MKILGVDPGIRGGLAIVRVDADDIPCLIDAIDIPIIGTKAKERVDGLAIRDWIAQHVPQHAAIERAQAMPKQGASSGFKYGRAVGAIESVIECCEILLTIIEPTAWKKFHQLRGGDKEAGRQRARQLFPGAHEARSQGTSWSCRSRVDRARMASNRIPAPAGSVNRTVSGQSAK
jgi:crossover junction endodeoxyribonuclease RuvC